MKKRLLASLLVAVMVLAAVSMVACQKTSPIYGYPFDKDTQAVYDEFVLPKYLGADMSDPTDSKNGVLVSWTSSDAAIKLTERDTDYLAEPVFPETGTKTVTLTLTHGKESREFTVKVNAIDVEDIASKYTFDKRNATVSADFALEQEATYKGKTATIAWSIKTGSSATISSDNKKCVVEPKEEPEKVTLTATFSFAGHTAKRNYTITVAKASPHIVSVDNWYSQQSGVTMDISGYILAVAEAYPVFADTGYISFYLLDEDRQASYYIYRAELGTGQEAFAAKFVPGTYVSITAAQNAYYKGVYETGQGKVKKSMITLGGKEALDMTKLEPYAIDNDLFAEAKAGDDMLGSKISFRNQSNIVSLTNWTVDKVVTSADFAADKQDGLNYQLLKLKKNDVTVTVGLSKYLQGVYTHKNQDAITDSDTVVKGISDIKTKFKAGDVVSVTGMFSYSTDNGGYQIYPFSAEDVKAGTADAAGTTYEGTTVGETLKAIATAVTTQKMNSLITANKEFTLTAGSANAVVTYSLCSDSATVTINDNKITVNPGRKETVYLKANVKVGDYEAWMLIPVSSEGKTDAEMIASEKGVLATVIGDISKVGETVLPIKGKTYETVTFSNWSLKEVSEFATVSEGKLVVTKLPSADTTITLTADIACGAVTGEKVEVTIKILKEKFGKVSVAELQTGKAYVLVMEQTNAKKTVFATGVFDGYYGASSEDITKAAQVYLESAEGGYKISFGNGADKKYLGFATYKDGTKNRYNLTIGGKIGGSTDGADIPSTATNVNKGEIWTITEEKMSVTAGSSTNSLGTSSSDTHTTFSLSNSKKMFFAYLAEVIE